MGSEKMDMRVVRHKPFGALGTNEEIESHVYNDVGEHFDSRLSLDIHQGFSKAFILIHNATHQMLIVLILLVILLVMANTCYYVLKCHHYGNNFDYDKTVSTV